MQNEASVETGAVQPVTYRWNSGYKTASTAHRNLSVTCAQDDPRRRRKSWNGAAGNTRDYDQDCDVPSRPRTMRAASSVTSPTRVRLIYEDEDAKARVCGNVQRLLNVAQKDPEAMSANAQLARKVLKYRRVMGRLDDVNVEDPDFDASAFFGIEWCHIGAPLKLKSFYPVHVEVYTYYSSETSAYSETSANISTLRRNRQAKAEYICICDSSIRLTIFLLPVIATILSTHSV